MRFSFHRATGLLWFLLVVPVSACLLWSCVTLDGALFGIGAMALGVAPLMWSWGPGGGRCWRRRGALACLLVWLGTACWLAWRQPDGQARSGSPVRNCYTGGGWRYHRLALGALLPEISAITNRNARPRCGSPARGWT